MRRAIHEVLKRRRSRVIARARVGIRCGASPQYTDSFGKIWAADSYFYTISGVVRTFRPTTSVVMGTPDPELYRDVRYADNLNAGNNIYWGYNIPISAGRYQVKLLYAEIFMEPASPGRIGNIDINGVRKLTNFNQVDAAGQNTAYQMIFEDIFAVNGFINIAITSVSNNFYITALEIDPT